MSVNLATGAATGSDAEGEILTSIEGLTGSKLADSLIGNGVANILNGGTCRYRSWYGLEDQLTATGRTGLKTPRPIQLLELRETRVGTCAKLSMGSAIQRFQRELDTIQPWIGHCTQLGRATSRFEVAPVFHQVMRAARIIPVG